MFRHPHPQDCPCCHRPGTVERRSGWWRVALVAGYILFSMMVFGSALLGPTSMAVLPFLLATGLGLLPYLHDKVSDPPTCSACGRIAIVAVAAAPARVEHVEPSPSLVTAS